MFDLFSFESYSYGQLSHYPISPLESVMWLMSGPQKSVSPRLCCQDDPGPAPVLAPPAHPGQCLGLRGGDDRAQAEHLLPLRQQCHPPGGEWRLAWVNILPIVIEALEKKPF